MNDTFCKGQIKLGVSRYRNEKWEQIDDTVSVEVPLQVSWSVPESANAGTARLWAWPEDLEPLALGHVLLDCTPAGHSLARGASVSEDGNGEFHVNLGQFQAGPFPEPPTNLRADELFSAMHAFISAQGQWDGTGCFHRAGVFDAASGKLLARSEDIGRHNCLDRLAGWSSLTQTPLTDKVLLTSARITASLCAKALRAGFRVLVSRSAVTTASISLAQENGVTLVGFARTDEQRLTLFTDTARRMSPALAR